MKEKFKKAAYPLCFINNVVNEFQKSKKCGDENFIIPPSLFEITKPFIFIEAPCCELNEIKSKYILKKFHKLMTIVLMVITWKTRNRRSLFPLKDENDYKSCVIYIVLVIHVTLVKPNITQKLDKINMIIHLKVQNHQNNFEATSSTVLHGLSF